MMGARSLPQQRFSVQQVDPAYECDVLIPYVILSEKAVPHQRNGLQYMIQGALEEGDIHAKCECRRDSIHSLLIPCTCICSEVCQCRSCCTERHRPLLDSNLCTECTIGVEEETLCSGYERCGSGKHGVESIGESTPAIGEFQVKPGETQ